MIVIIAYFLTSPSANRSLRILVHVKWQKEKFQDVELDTSEPPIVFKSQLYALSGVEPERQKVMVAGKTIEVRNLAIVKFRGAWLTMLGLI